MALLRAEIERKVESRLFDLGFELVSIEWAGARSRPVIRIRMDRIEEVECGVTVADCAHVSRALESWLDEQDEFPERYVLEVSSPGVERPLRGIQDWERFAGKPVIVEGYEVLAERSSRLEADLLGLEPEPEPTVRLKLGDGTEVGVPLADIKGAHLMLEWE